MRAMSMYSIQEQRLPCICVQGWLARPQTVLQLTGGAEEMKTMKVLGRGGEPAKEPESRTETPGSKSKVRRWARRIRTAVSGCICLCSMFPLSIHRAIQTGGRRIIPTYGSLIS